MNKEQPGIPAKLRGGLIVSCQALEGEPLYGAEFMVALARAAEMGGAVAIRANTPQDIRAIRENCPLPVIGLYKQIYPNSDIYITPTMKEVLAVAAAGADIIAVDATGRPRPDGMSLQSFIHEAKAATGRLVMADVSTFAEGLAAVEAGADLVSTTLSGYTPYSRQEDGPDFELIASLVAALPVPVVAEGRIWTPEEARQALDVGAFAVVVGTAITRPQEIVRRFVQAIIAERGDVTYVAERD